MSQLNNDKLILLSVPDDKIYRKLCGILKIHNFRVMRATTFQAAIQKIIEFSPDLIICSHDFSQYDAFQVYALLRRTTLDFITPFIIYAEKYDLEEIMMGLELGIDNFIFAPINEKEVIAKLKVLSEKIEKRKAIEKIGFEKLFASSPVGMLVCKSNKIERANPAFYKLMVFNRNVSLPLINDIFFFRESPEQEKQFFKCIKGLISDCIVPNVYLKGENEYVANLYISNISNYAISRMLIQVDIYMGIPGKRIGENAGVKMAERLNEQTNDYMLTSREYDVLEVSGKGMPIKLIASELGISQRTVEKHRSNIMRKTSSLNIIEAIGKVYGMNHNLVYK